MLGLAPHIHVAAIDDRIVALDLRADQYRLLDGRKARALTSLSHDGLSDDEEAMATLLTEGILTKSWRPVRRPAFTMPQRGALECPDPGGLEWPWPELAMAAAATALRLRMSRLDRALAWARNRHTRVGPADATPQVDLIACAHAFERARMHVPLRRACLRDAMLFARLVGRRRLDCRIVIGVRLDPFGAHSWVQADDLVLTGELGTARQLTPILAI